MKPVSRIALTAAVVAAFAAPQTALGAKTIDQQDSKRGKIIWGEIAPGQASR